MDSPRTPRGLARRLDEEEAHRLRLEAELQEAAHAGVALLSRNEELERLVAELRSQAAQSSKPSVAGAFDRLAPAQHSRSARKVGFQVSDSEPEERSDDEQRMSSLSRAGTPEVRLAPSKRKNRRCNTQRFEELIETNEALLRRSQAAEDERRALEKHVASLQQGQRRISSGSCSSSGGTSGLALSSAGGGAHRPTGHRDSPESELPEGSDGGEQEADRATLSAQVGMLRERLSEREAQLEASDERDGEIASLLASVQAELRSHKQECDDLRAETSRLSAELRHERGEREAMRGECHAAVKEAASFRQRVESMAASSGARRMCGSVSFVAPPRRHPLRQGASLLDEMQHLASMSSERTSEDGDATSRRVSVVSVGSEVEGGASGRRCSTLSVGCEARAAGSETGLGETRAAIATKTGATCAAARQSAMDDARTTPDTKTTADRMAASEPEASPELETPCSRPESGGDGGDAAELRRLCQELREELSEEREIAAAARRGADEARGELQTAVDRARGRSLLLERERCGLQEEARAAARQRAALDAQNQALIGHLERMKQEALEVGFWESLYQNLTCTRKGPPVALGARPGWSAPVLAPPPPGSSQGASSFAPEPASVGLSNRPGWWSAPEPVPLPSPGSSQGVSLFAPAPAPL